MAYTCTHVGYSTSSAEVTDENIRPKSIDIWPITHFALQKKNYIHGDENSFSGQTSLTFDLTQSDLLPNYFTKISIDFLFLSYYQIKLSQNILTWILWRNIFSQSSMTFDL